MECLNSLLAVKDRSRDVERIKDHGFLVSELNKLDPSSKWYGFGFHPILQHKIIESRLAEPTSIQAELFLHLSSGADIVAQAPTGAGKTLAFGLMIINGLLVHNPSDRDISAIIVVPTRELGIQVHRALYPFVKDTHIRTVCVVGGISIQKQEKKLNRKTDIVVATLGRLWSFIRSNILFADRFANLQYLVVDEVDKMVEDKSFKDLENIFQTCKASRTLVFSATALHDIHSLSRIPFQSSPIYIDQTLIPRLLPIQEFKFQCPEEERDLYLYSFLESSSGKRVVFFNSIDVLCRLRSILEHLRIKAITLHGQMRQKQRLDHLDKFKDQENGVMLCTNVFSRGMDLENIEWIVHYSIPSSRETYIHRCGRAGRTGGSRSSLMFIVPSEFRLYKAHVHCSTIQDHMLHASDKQRKSLGCAIELSILKKADRNRHLELRICKELGIPMHNHDRQQETLMLEKRLERLLSQS